MYTAVALLSDKREMIFPEEFLDKLSLKPGEKFLVMGHGDSITLKIASENRRDDFWEKMDKEMSWAKEVGMTEDDISMAIKQVRAKHI